MGKRILFILSLCLLTCFPFPAIILELCVWWMLQLFMLFRVLFNLLFYLN